MLPTLLLVLVAVNLHDANAAVTQREIEDILPLIFSGTEVSTKSKLVKDDVPDECKDKTYCTIKTADYPEERFNKMFKGLKFPPQASLVLEPMLTNRQGDPDATDDCDSQVTYEPLYKVRAKRGEGEWRFVVQAQSENYVQRVRLEVCSNPKASCFNAVPITSDFRTFCKQKYNKWEVLVSKGVNDTEKLEVELPVCCSCQYEKASIESRFGVSKKMSPVKSP